MSLTDDGARQMHERIGNALTTLNRYRAQHLEDARIESIMTELETIQETLEERGWFTPSRIREMDFHILEGTPMEGNEHLGRELQSIRNFVENKL